MSSLFGRLVNSDSDRLGYCSRRDEEEESHDYRQGWQELRSREPQSFLTIPWYWLKAHEYGQWQGRIE